MVLTFFWLYHHRTARRNGNSIYESIFLLSKTHCRLLGNVRFLENWKQSFGQNEQIWVLTFLSRLKMKICSIGPEIWSFWQKFCLNFPMNLTYFSEMQRHTCGRKILAWNGSYFFLMKPSQDSQNKWNLHICMYFFGSKTLCRLLGNVRFLENWKQSFGQNEQIWVLTFLSRLKMKICSIGPEICSFWQ